MLVFLYCFVFVSSSLPLELISHGSSQEIGLKEVVLHAVFPPPPPTFHTFRCSLNSVGFVRLVIFQSDFT